MCAIHLKHTYDEASVIYRALAVENREEIRTKILDTVIHYCKQLCQATDFYPSNTLKNTRSEHTAYVLSFRPVYWSVCIQRRQLDCRTSKQMIFPERPFRTAHV